MKKLLWLIVAFFAGQAVTMYHKDKTLQNKIKKEPDFVAKATLFFRSLLDFNKKTAQEYSQKLAELSPDIQQFFIDSKAKITHTIEHLQHVIKDNNQESLDEAIAQAKSYIKQMEDKITSLKWELSAEYDTLDKEFGISEGITKLKTLIAKK